MPRATVVVGDAPQDAESARVRWTRQPFVALWVRNLRLFFVAAAVGGRMFAFDTPGRRTSGSAYEEMSKDPVVA